MTAPHRHAVPGSPESAPIAGPQVPELQVSGPQVPGPQVKGPQAAQIAGLSPYMRFDEAQWARLRGSARLTLSEEEIAALESLNAPVTIEQVKSIYLPLARLLTLYASAIDGLHTTVQTFLNKSVTKTPFIVGIAGSVAAGKSTSARLLCALLRRMLSSGRVDLVTTDGFLYPNHELEKRGLMRRKGFPESYDRTRLLQFLTDIKAGHASVSAPVYSHITYDIVADKMQAVCRPEILIVEGLNVLQPAQLPPAGLAIPMVSDFFDFSIFIDVDPAILEKWYVMRFMKLRQTAFRNPLSYFRKYAQINDSQAYKTAQGLWRDINLVNLHENILPTRPRADLILTKAEDHFIVHIDLRRL